ncbi:hypothetical protein LTR62_001508 [Meristemomyces frigidus]|uniref:Uncharacterized protein n=1 Tax=Meristemomyces frigidus TaxID=1508187 RepID=A0AAN7YI82_9PEZI|nr:hypothetical protein LTR62_001508 [Meristemomyces frigidus]
MSSKIPANSVWSAMNYTPPRGRCNYKASLMSPACPCLRFMLHPVKAATSFECDGCNHHASFHLLENPTEDTVLKKWAEQEVRERDSQATVTNGSKKRKALTQAVAAPGEFDVRFEEVGDVLVSVGGSSRGGRRKK